MLKPILTFLPSQGFFDHELPTDSLSRGIYRKAKVWPFAKGQKGAWFGYLITAK